MSQLSVDANILGILRTRQRQDVPITTRAVLERMRRDPVFAPRIGKYVYATLHHHRPKSDPFDWHTTLSTLLVDLNGEPRAAVYLESMGAGRTIAIDLTLNCNDEIVQEKVEGKRRKVPMSSETSTVSVSIKAWQFADPDFTRAYLDLLADLFEIIDGVYGEVEHTAIEHGNAFVRLRHDPLEPWFITWANFFGPDLVARLGRDRLLSAPAHEVRELPGGSIVLTVAASPLEQLEPHVQECIARVKQDLGILSPSERATPEELAAFEARHRAREEEMKRNIEEAFRRAREETAAEMRRQAEGCVEGVRRFWGETLDFSPESLQVIDRLIATGFSPQEDEETIRTAVQAFGAYVGEVVRRQMGGVWHDEEMRGQPVLLEVGRGKQRLKPFEAVRRRFQERGRVGGLTLVAWFEGLRREGAV